MRKQFGRTLDANQHIQFKMAEMATDIHVSLLLIPVIGFIARGTQWLNCSVRSPVGPNG